MFRGLLRLPQLHTGCAAIRELDAGGLKRHSNVGEGGASRNLVSVLKIHDRYHLQAAGRRDVILRPA